MSTGLVALLDDVAAIAKVAAASLDDMATQAVSSMDDVALQATKAGTKSAGVVIDDAAVTPRYVVGFTADREIPIVAKIARGSLFNKLVILLPVALLLSLFAPWAITPLLMLGGLFLCYEGAEKVYELLVPHEAHAHEEKIGLEPGDPQALEDQKVRGAIRTDFILSAEIMAIALATIPDVSLGMRGVVLALVAVAITVGVYGVVGLIVKADDFGVALAATRSGLLRALGRGLVKGMPAFLKVLAGVGTAAMVWVGGGILVHGLGELGAHGPEHVIHTLAVAAGNGLPALGGLVTWLVEAACYGVVGLAAGGLLIPLVSRVVVPAWRALRGR
jgi:predicted DNA repair protein MutK